MAQSISINGVKVVVESLLGRRKLKNSFEYGACAKHVVAQQRPETPRAARVLCAQR